MDRVEVSPRSETGRLRGTGTGVRLAELVATLSLGIDLRSSVHAPPSETGFASHETGWMD